MLQIDINMKKIIFLLVQIAFMANVYSQGFLKDGLTWNNTKGGSYSQNSNFTYKVQGDTTINGVIYKIIKENYPDIDTNWNTRIYARENNGKWFFKVIGTSAESMDIPYYNFNVNVGDTVDVWNSYDEWHHRSAVSSIDSVTLENGERRKRIHLSNWYGDIWVEGIGSVIHYLDTPLSMFGEFRYLCAKQDDTLLYTLFPNLNCYDTGGIFMNLVDVSKDNIVSLYPNPAKSEVNISSESIINSIEVFNSLGQKVYQTNVKAKGKTLDINSLSKGVYIIGVSTDMGYIRKKLIKE